ncbi:MAG: hypothetical protein LLG06_04385 [Desulfobacteraceae bacterium]|nr:hypothetical protein [Desulfobacteraceae bacterium]
MGNLRIGHKIALAREYYAKWGDDLKAESGVSAMVRELAAKAADSAGMCVESGVADACGRCDRNEGGSCCGAGIENRYTPEMLLINLLMGAVLPDSRDSEKSCYFLSGRGCVLSAREVLCINYLCARLQREIPGEKLILLQETNGKEMDILFALHDRIKQFVRRKTP